MTAALRHLQAHPVEVGQRWMSSDPRRLSAFIIRFVDHGVVVATNIYPPSNQYRVLPIERFAIIGPKGYMRI